MLSTGLVWTYRDYETLRADIEHGDPALQFLVHDTIDASRDWLASHGIALTPLQDVLHIGRGRFMDPRQAIEKLSARLEALGGTIRTSTALDRLTECDGAITGAIALQAGRPVTIEADAVVLATGGFHGNPELLGRYVTPNPSGLFIRGNPWSTGDGFLAATAMGAAASPGLSNFYGHALLAPPAKRSPADLGAVSQFQGLLGVVLNLDGARFIDESAGRGEEIINQAIARQPHSRAFVIADAETLDAAPLQGIDLVTSAIIARAKLAGAVVIEAATIADLCAGMAAHGMHQSRARATLEAYETAMRNGSDDIFPSRARHRTRFAGPYAATLAQAAITFTMGGLAVDERLRVLRRAASSSPLAPVPQTRAFADTSGAETSIGNEYRQTPIPGLFAAGCDTGNIHHGAYMGGLAVALTTGRAAGAEAAAG